MGKGSGWSSRAHFILENGRDIGDRKISEWSLTYRVLGNVMGGQIEVRVDNDQDEGREKCYWSIQHFMINLVDYNALFFFILSLHLIIIINYYVEISP